MKRRDQHDPKMPLIHTWKNSPNAFGQLFVSMCDFFLKKRKKEKKRKKN
jgi:hypothetical protein